MRDLEQHKPRCELIYLATVNPLKDLIITHFMNSLARAIWILSASLHNKRSTSLIFSPKYKKTPVGFTQTFSVLLDVLSANSGPLSEQLATLVIAKYSLKYSLRESP